MKPPTYALRLAASGIPCFPCNENKKPACEHGFKDATSDERKLEALWKRSPGRLIGIPNGPPSNLDLLDIDPRHGGEDWLAEFARYIPITLTVQTLSGGTHFFFRHRTGMRNTQSTIAPGVDTRGDGGYTIMWAASGGQVTHRAPPAEWPDWLFKIATTPKKAAQVAPLSQPLRPITEGKRAEIALGIIGRQLYNVETAPDGQRHSTVRNAARTIGGLIGELGISIDDAAQKLLEAVLRAGAEDKNNATKTIAWGLHLGTSAPLSIGRSL